MNDQTDPAAAPLQDLGRLLTPAEVAQLFGVSVKTVYRWARQGRIPRLFTPGGHGRYWETDVHNLLETGAPR